jgi:hypothetical protein
MEFLGIFSSALLLSSLLLIILNIYCIYAYYKLTDKINKIYFVIDSVLKDPEQNAIVAEENKKEINILPENFKHFYPTSQSSLIEVSSDDDTTSTYETYSDCEQEYIDCEIKNVHMSLDLDDLEDIHVLLLDEISNVEQIKEPITSQEVVELIEETKTTQQVVELIEKPKTTKEVLKLLEEPKSTQELLKEENNILILTSEICETNEVSEISEPKELNFKQKKRESRKNMGNGDYKKMNLTDLRKYIIENAINIDASKMKKPEILKAMEELKKNEYKENIDDEFKEPDSLKITEEIVDNECKEIINECKEIINECKEIVNECKDDEIVNKYFVE